MENCAMGREMRRLLGGLCLGLIVLGAAPAAWSHENGALSINHCLARSR